MLLALLTMLTGPTAPAAAEPTDASGQTRSVCAVGDGTADYQYLPVERWSGATQQMHVRSGGGSPIDFAPLQRQSQGSLFAIGDFLYSVTTNFVMWATEFCPLQSVGASIDSAAAQFGRSLLGSPLLAGIVALAAAGLLVQGLRKEGAWLPRLAVKMVIVGVLVVMVAGATGSRVDDSGRFVPGAGSPGWFATTIDEAITEIASAPAGALPTPTDSEGAGVDTDQLSCGAYINALRRGYDDSARDGTTLIDAKTVPAQTISNLWQVSGYRAWSVGQFGRDNLNGQSRIACRMLDHNAAIPAGVGSFQIEGRGAENNRSAATRADVLSRVPDPRIAISQVGVNPDAPAWRPMNRVEQDKAWIAWAACVPKDGLLSNLKARDGWHAPRGQGWLIADEGARRGAEEGRSVQLNAACFAFFNTASDKVGNIFDWGDGDTKIKENAGQMPASIYDLISALHGSNLGAGASAAIGYLLSALGVAAVFGTIGLTIMIVKAVAAFMLFSVIVVAVLCLLPRADNSRLIGFVKMYIGLSITAAFAVFILSLITLFTNLVLTVIKGFVGPNSDMMLIVGGMAPVMVAIALHFALKRVGMPSPLTVRGAMAWGNALAGGQGLSAIRMGGQQLYQGAKDLMSRGRDRLSGSQADGSRTSGRLGKRNSDLSSDQPLKPRTASDGSRIGPSPVDILNDPNSTLAQRRAAQRKRLAEVDALRQDRAGGEESGQTGSPQGQPAGEAGAGRARRAADRDAGVSGAGPVAGGTVATGLAAMKRGVARRFARGGGGAERARARAWGGRYQGDAADPIRRSSRAMAAVARPPARLGSPAQLVAGSAVGVVASRRAQSAIQRRRRSHASNRQEQMSHYRNRIYAQRQSEAQLLAPASRGVNRAPASTSPSPRPTPPGPPRSQQDVPTWPTPNSGSINLSGRGETRL